MMTVFADTLMIASRMDAFEPTAVARPGAGSTDRGSPGSDAGSRPAGAERPSGLSQMPEARGRASARGAGPCSKEP